VNVAQQRYFYDIPEALLAKAYPQQNIDSQFVEKAFSQMEAVLNRLIAEIIESAERQRVIPRHLRLSLAPCIIIQSLRTFLMRDLIQETNDKLIQAIVDSLMQRNFPEVPKDQYPQFQYNRQLAIIQSIRMFFDEDRIVKLSEMINRHIWFIGINKTIQPFYTSDHPVVKKANIVRPDRSFNGFRSPGIEIAFPLSSGHILVILERSYFQRMASADGKARLMDPEGVEHFNALQVLKCHRHVFCEANQFEQALGVCRQHPEACSSDRAKVRVVETDDRFGMLFQD
jgi:hypothetical protein